MQPSLYEHAVYFKFFQTLRRKETATARVEKERWTSGGEIYKGAEEKGKKSRRDQKKERKGEREIEGEIGLEV